MKAAAVFPDKKSLSVVNDFPEPKLESAYQCQTARLNVGVCGTDREIASFQYGFPPPEGSEFLVIGHECLGEVIEAGPEVHDLKPGDLAIPMVRRPCDHPECIACRAGRQDFCYTGDYRERGIKQMHGFLTETDCRRRALHESRAGGDSRCRRSCRTSDDRRKGTAFRSRRFRAGCRGTR